MDKRHQRKFHSFADFWPHYVMAHLHPRTYWMHAIGIVIGVTYAAICLLTQNPLWSIGGIVIGYGFAIPSHFLFEGNRPASFYAPIYSFMADFKLSYCVLTGRMEAVKNEIMKQYGST